MKNETKVSKVVYRPFLITSTEEREFTKKWPDQHWHKPMTDEQLKYLSKVA